jgi:hypothetical protein
MTISAVERSWQLLTDEELHRWAGFYRHRLALVDAEVRDPFEREPTRQYLAMLVGDATREEASRAQAAHLGVPRDRDHFPAEFVADLKARVKLDHLLEYEAGAQLKPASRRGVRRGPCPFCRASERSDCLAVYTADAADQHYFCHRCGAAGDAISAIMQVYGDSFRAAVERLAGFGGVPLPAPPPDPGGATGGRRMASIRRGKRAAFFPR